MKVIEWDENTQIRLQLWDIAGNYDNITNTVYRYIVIFLIEFWLPLQVSHCS